MASVTIETKYNAMGHSTPLSTAVTRAARQMGSRYLDRTIIGIQAQGVPQCRLVRPLGIPDAEDGAGAPGGSRSTLALMSHANPGSPSLTWTACWPGTKGLGMGRHRLLTVRRELCDPYPGLLPRLWLNTPTAR
jgi:hypothetical protein